MIYLLKVTVVWALFLLLFEAFYKSSGKFKGNRFYLLFSIVAGLLLPLIPLPSYVPTVLSTTQAFYPAIIDAVPHVTAPGLTIAAPTEATSHLNIWLMLKVLYGLGIAFLVLQTLLESARITRLILRHPRHLVAGHKVIVTGTRHAPYSFMGWIFINDLNAYEPAELEYIIRHEAAHNYQQHWLDLLLLQLACTVLWFHPLIWRYRYLLKLQHEYEADDLAARDDTYAYGHFLLQQTLLKGVPSIAHSFHFSPIKNRIKMLIKKQTRKTSAWKYFLIAPALLGCSFLMAKTSIKADRVRQGNVTTYNGSTFNWRETDTLYYDNIAKAAKRVAAKAEKKPQVIFEMNGEPVYQNEYLKAPATYSESKKMDYSDYLRKEFSTQRKNIQDSLTAVMVSNLVIDKEGNVAYYDLRSSWYPHKYLQKEWHPYGDQAPVLNKIMDKIIMHSPKWKPATINGKPVNTVISVGGGC